MTADVTWPYSDLQPRKVSADIVTHSTSGGRSLSGSEQVLMSDAGYWEITLEQIPITTNDDVLLWRTIESALKGRSKTILVPTYSRKFAPTGGLSTISAQVSGSISQNAISGDIEILAGGTPEAGEDFSIGERLYRIKSVDAQSGSVYTVTFWPPAREAIADNAVVEFDHPVCRCRLKTEREMDVTLSLLKFAEPSVTFCEDV